MRHGARPPLDWATLLRRSFEVDVLRCLHCADRLRVLGEVTEPSLVRLVLETLELPPDAPRAARARDPSELPGPEADWLGMRPTAPSEPRGLPTALRAPKYDRVAA
jgi:hypothetical protein